jgi:hypothetical protein
MKVFEFHFNPKSREELVFDSFCYEPENIYEKRLGSLYMVGLLKNALPTNRRLLENLAEVIKREYYRSTRITPQKAMKESLKEANEFLEQIAKRGDVSWLGNLSFTVVSLKNFDWNFTKVGEIKFFLLRGGKIIDIDRKIRLEEFEPYPLRIFGNVVSGKLAEEDLILILTKEVFDFFEKEDLLNEFAQLSPVDEENLKKVFEKRREEILKISGICFAIGVTKEIIAKREIIWPKISPKEFNIKDFLSPILNFFRKIKISTIGRKFWPTGIKIPQMKFIRSFGKKIIPRKPKLLLSKNVITVLALILVLILGLSFSRWQEKKELKNYKNILIEAQEKLNKAEGFLVLKDPKLTKEANKLLMESLEEISPVIKVSADLPKDFKKEVLSLNEKVSKRLFEINKLEEIKEPELFFDFKGKDFAPQKMVSEGKNLYFFNSYSQNLFILGKDVENGFLQIDKKFNLATAFDDSVLFFSKPNRLTILSWPLFFSFSLQEPYPDFNFDDLSAFKRNLYFLDKKAGQIIKYPYLTEFEWGKPEFWLKKAIQGKSITVDGSVWVLEKDAVLKYSGGDLKEKIELDVFPYPKDLTKIFTSPTLPYLFVLEPSQKRLLIFDKSGQIFKQFKSEKFDNLLDFAISKDGKTIYLLNGLRVYKIELKF